MPIDGTEPVSAADLNIALGGVLSDDDLGQRPASVEDLQLVVQGMQEQSAADMAVVTGATLMGADTGSSVMYKKSAGWGSSNNVPATGRYRVSIFCHGTSSYGDESFYIKLNSKVVYEGTASDISGYKAVMLMSEIDLNAGKGVYVTANDGESLVWTVQRIK